MKQAYQHLEPGTTYYQLINNQITGLVKRWNLSHIKQTDPKVIGDIFKTIFKYHHWIKIDDIESVIDLGLMGEFGENKGLNSETIFNWFKQHSKQSRDSEIKSHGAYHTESTFISMNQRKETREALIKKFMEFYNQYQKEKVLPDMNHYVPVFFRWFKKLGYITLSEEQEMEIHEAEVKANREFRSILTQMKKGPVSKTAKEVFVESFQLAANNNYPIYDQLKQMEI